MTPVVSVVTITYNHEPFIEDCIKGVLSQKVDFPIEFIIAEDHGTDGTRQICHEYAEKYPALIRLLPSDTNLGIVENEQRAFLKARGKYIATCEGDDYWTDPFKLQKQVDFLEGHPDYSVCFHRFKRFHSWDGTWESDFCDNLFPDSSVNGMEISMHQFMHQWVTQYLSMVFRKDCYDFDACHRYNYFRDTHQVYHLMLNGKCWLFNFEGGVYRMTGDGMYSTKDAFHQEQMTLAVDTELWKVNGDKGWKEMCTIVMQHMIESFYLDAENRAQLKQYIGAIFRNTLSVRKLTKNIILFWKNGANS